MQYWMYNVNVNAFNIDANICEQFLTLSNNEKFNIIAGSRHTINIAEERWYAMMTELATSVHNIVVEKNMLQCL